MLPRQYRLSPSSLFNTIFQKGRKFKGEYGMFIVLCDSDVAHETSELQIGFVVSKKIGNAVRRHKHVRRLRSIFVEYMRKNPDYLNGCKSTYISFKYAEEYSDLASDFNKLFDRAGDYFKD